MEDLLERSISLQDIASYYSSPWAWVITYVLYCLTIGTVQCRVMANGLCSNGGKDDIFILSVAQIFSPITSVFFILSGIIGFIGFIVNKLYFKEN